MLDDSEDDVVSSDIASDSSNVDVLGGLRRSCCYVCKQRWAGLNMETLERAPIPRFGEHVRCTAHAWALFRESMVLA